MPKKPCQVRMRCRTRACLASVLLPLGRPLLHLALHLLRPVLLNALGAPVLLMCSCLYLSCAEQKLHLIDCSRSGDQDLDHSSGRLCAAPVTGDTAASVPNSCQHPSKVSSLAQ